MRYVHYRDRGSEAQLLASAFRGRVTAVAEELRFYVDESALGLGKALEAARRDTVYTGHPLIPECPKGTLDTDWIPAVAARDLVVIGRDRRIRTKPQEVARFREAHLR